MALILPTSIIRNEWISEENFDVDVQISNSPPLHFVVSDPTVFCLYFLQRLPVELQCWRPDLLGVQKHLLCSQTQLHDLAHLQNHHSINKNTVEPLYNSHLGAEITGHCREVAVVGRLEFE